MSVRDDLGGGAAVIWVDIKTTGAEEAESAIKGVGRASAETGQQVRASGMDWQVIGHEIREATEPMRIAISPVRSLSWDFILMGRGLSIMNTHLLGNSQAMRELVGVIYSFGAVLRVIVALVDIANTGKSIMIMLSHYATQATLQEAAAQRELAAATTAVSVAQGAKAGTGIWSTISGILFNLFAGAGSAALLAFQHGGVIPATGPYLMHKGETVTPAGSSFSQITINMSAGAISSNVDVDRMLDDMALRMAQESRRRTG
jgi:hypothetical protein